MVNLSGPLLLAGVCSHLGPISPRRPSMRAKTRSFEFAVLSTLI